MLRNALSAPLVDRGGEGFLHRVFRYLEIAHAPDHGRHDAGPIGAINLFDCLIGEAGHHLMVKKVQAAVDFGPSGSI